MGRPKPMVRKLGPTKGRPYDEGGKVGNQSKTQRTTRSH